MSYLFTLRLTGVSEVTQDIEDTLFEADCEALLCSRDGVVFLDFEIEAENHEAAVRSAIDRVQKAGFTATEEPDCGHY